MIKMRASRERALKELRCYHGNIILNDTENTGRGNKFVLEICETFSCEHFFARRVKFKAQIKKK